MVIWFAKKLSLSVLDPIKGLFVGVVCWILVFVLLFVYLGGGVWFSPDSAISEKKIAMLFKINVYLCVCGGDVGVFLSIDACIVFWV